MVVTGVTTEVCVNTTVREANDRGYDCLVLEDCVASYFPEFQQAALAMIKAQGGIFGWVWGTRPIRRRSTDASPLANPSPRRRSSPEWRLNQPATCLMRDQSSTALSTGSFP
jgi:hypothetical protein